MSLIKAMATGDEGVAEGVGLPGDERLFAFARLSPPWQELRVAIGLPREWAIDKVNRDLRRNLIWLAAGGDYGPGRGLVRRRACLLCSR